MIKFSNVNKIYNEKMNNEYHALKDVNLTINDTGLVLIYGKSGSGKTTLLNLISRLDKISSGTLEISYKEPYSSFLFQDAQLLEQYTVKENLELAMDIANNHIDITNYLKKYELEDLLNHKANQLSSGQKMRVALVRAILLNRAILICDEPTGALDSTNSKIIAKELIELSKTKLVIVASHDSELFINDADQIIEISDGIVDSKIIKEENKKEMDYSFESKLPIKDFIKFSFKNTFNKSIIKYILNGILFTIAFILLLGSLFTLTFSEAKARYNVYKENNLPYFVHSCDDLDKELEDDRKFRVYYEPNIFDFEFRMALITNKCDYPILYGKDTINLGEIIISESIAKRLSLTTDFEDVLNTTLMNLKIVGIYKDTEQCKCLDFNGFIWSSNNNSILISKEDYEESYFAENDFDITFGINDFNAETQLHIKLDETLADDEVIISKYYQDNIDDKLDLICHTKAKKYNTEKEGYYKLSFSKIKYVEKGNYVYVSKNNYKILKEIKLSSNGCLVGIKDYTVDDIKNTLRNKEAIYSDFESNIDITKENQSIIAAVDAGFAVVISIFTLISLLNYINVLISRSKREMGVLLSLGLKKKKLYLLFIPSTILLFSICFIISIPLGILMFNYQKNMFNFTLTIPVNYGYINFLTIPLLFICVLFILFIFIFLLTNRIKKNNIIDLIYEK